MAKKLTPFEAANAEIVRLKVLIAAQRTENVEAVAAADASEKSQAATERRLRDADEERNFLRQANRALELRLERAKGYIDRIVEREEVEAAPEFRHEPLPKPPLGPSLNDIDMPMKNARNDGFPQFLHGERQFGRRY